LIPRNPSENLGTLGIKDSTDTGRSASYLDLHLEIDSEGVKNETLQQKR
jgi:hypothetical protein